MASSQVEIAVTSPFGCVLRKYNRRERGSFEKDVRNFVREHCLNSNSIPTQDRENADNNENQRSNNEKEKDETSRWTARKAREMVSTIETEAELLAVAPPTSSGASLSPEISNRGASSLVQIWEKRLNNNSQYDDCTDESSYSEGTSERVESTSNEPSCSTPKQAQTQAQAGKDSDAERVRVADIIKRLKMSCGDESNEQERCNSNNNSTTMMGSSSSSRYLTRSNSLSRLRVRPSTMTTSTEQSEQHRSFLHVLSSPRIRGRRAFTDLLMQMERDRHGELNLLAQRAPVSKFSQRGRIQSMLRLRLLQRRQAANGNSSSTSEVNKQPQGSSIMHLRERFNLRAENGSPAQTEGSPRSPRPSQLISKDPHTNTHTHSHSDEESSVPSSETCLEAQNVDPQTHTNGESHGPSSETCLEAQNVDPQTHTNGESHGPSSETCLQAPNVDPQTHTNGESHGPSSETCLQAPNVESQEIMEKATPSSVVYSNVNEIENEAEAEEEQHNVEPETSNYVEERINNEEEDAREEQLNGENNYDDDNDVLEAEDSDEQQYDDETYFDWISHISRPRSYWEDRRQAWYKEMLHSTATSDKLPEIRQLLERRTVSTFLSSDFRERMDNLMESHIGTQTHLMSSQEDDEDHLGKMDQLMQFLQQHIRLAHNLEEEEGGGGGRRQEEGEEEEEVVVVVEEEGKEVKTEEEEDEEEEEEEEGSLNNGGAYINEEVVSDYFNQSSPSTHIPNYSSPSPNISRWSYRDNNEASDDSDRVESSSSPEPSRSQSFYQESRQCSSSSTNRHSNIEMELIYDLRGQMEQLHREMTEMRKSIQSCMDMQMLLQQSMKQEVNTVKEKKKKSHDKPKKGNCCICYEKKVDSLLYRCGHMCACLKCANELQWNSGKCPICRAPIVDVVRVYLNA